MKTMKRLLPLALAFLMVLALAIPASAANGTGTITVNNAARGETYEIYKIFDATLNDDNTGITYTYTGTLPAELSAVFEKVSGTDYVQKKDGVTNDAILAEIKAYFASNGAPTAAASQVANGDTVVFDNVPYGYYYVTSTLGSAVAVTSTKPNAVIYEKNSDEPTAEKTVEKESYSIGDTVKYTATFDTTNYLGEGADAKQVVEYVISDTLPEYISDVTVTKITIGGTETTLQQFDDDGKITITWATKNNDNTYTSIYNQGAKIVIEYQGTLTSTVNINADNKNTITLEANVDDGEGGTEPWKETWEDSAEIKTYAAAIKKTDSEGNPLAGAQFTIKGLTVTGADGVYTVVSYDPNSTTPSTALDTDADGMLYIVGLASDAQLIVTECKAPDGYNKLTGTETLTPQVMTAEIFTKSGTRYYDADGNLVSEQSSSSSYKTVEKNLSDLDEDALQIKNYKGTELPSTGGIGTTIFYITGAALVVGAGVLLFVRKRAGYEG